MSQNGPVHVEMTLDPAPTNGPLSTFAPLNHDPEDDMSDDFAIPEDDSGDNMKEVFVVLEMLDDDERFGFSVMGGIEEGFLPRVDEILPGSPADRSDLDIGDEILEVNGKSLHNASHSEVISHIHQCVRSRTISLRVRRRIGLSGGEPDQEKKQVQEAYVIAVEQQAKDKIAKLARHNYVNTVDLATLPPLTNASGDVINGYSEPSYTTDDGFSYPPAEEEDLYSPDTGVPSVNSGFIAEPEIEAETISGEKSQVDFGTLNGIQNEAYSSSTESLPDLRLQNNGVNTVTASAAVEPFTNIEDTESVRSYEYPDYNGQGAVVDEPALECSVIAPVELSPQALEKLDEPTQSSQPVSEENASEMVVQAEQQPLKPERGMHREVAVDCPPGFVAASGMKNPPPQYTPQQNGGSSVVLNGTDVLPSSHPVEKSGKKKSSSKKQRIEEGRGIETQNASQNNSQGATLAFQPVSTKALFNDDPKAHVEAATNNRKTVELSQLLSNLEQMQAKLRDSTRPETVQFLGSLFQNPGFQQALEVHNQLVQVHQQTQVPLPVTSSAQQIAAEVKAGAKTSQSDEAQELTRILETPEFKSLLSTHDNIASRDPTQMLGPEDQEDDLNLEMVEEDSVKIVRIDKTNEPLGATILNDGEAVVIGRIIKGGMAERSGLLHEGDEILEINGNDIRGKSVNEICEFMSALSGTLTFLMVPCKQHNIKQQSKDTALIHMRAHFDYDPEDDMYIPCRELGLSFHKGDILHVIAQDDSNWWQAYREGEEDQTLAGLIPSRSFQQQREAMKQTMPEDEEPKKKLFCGGKSKKKKKKKKLYNANGNDQSSDEILTYEEVGLYQPDPSKKRPVVLIGPPKVGRHELRQRLLETDERFAAAVPHTSRPKKDHEVHGLDYYFTTRQRFEQDIQAEKFVEHGEFEKNIYGTSLEAIRSVVEESKICVLNLHPQSLKVLKNSDLRPYFIFVCPPSLDRLRQQRTEVGDLLKEEELREIIETGRAMEDTYGHYFDYVIIHYDHERAYSELVEEINRIQLEPQWVPLSWLES
ncbi:MAGUK p55 subfamily member 5-like isoform X2 [Acanthaster planci]|uniref:MAGUK p55 subfamily member 5-like isoform X2 n=1 Tax=Acanthaster planci TaxID=133434 RepID=A0A8B7YMV4_ACAPL|nr:MAGUK p55 subfamily member 5-like isoform X2 [Acanthaster planci]